MNFFIRHKARSDFVVVHTFFSLIGKVFGYIEIGVLSWFDDICINLEGEGSEIAIVDSSSSDDVFFNVLTEWSDDQVELRFRI